MCYARFQLHLSKLGAAHERTHSKPRRFYRIKAMKLNMYNSYFPKKYHQLHISFLVAIDFLPFSVFKRNNAYGDEPVAPAEGYRAPRPEPAPVEQAPAPIEQAAEAPAAVESSGYRKKRNNAYGDEPIAPAAGVAEPAPAPVEMAPAPVEQAAEAPAPVESSGYRKKRNNAYGDEPVAPAGGYAAAEPAPAPVEQAPAPIEQAAEAPAAVESSGYRKKRNNAYGDEPVAPSGGYAAAQPAPAPVEQAPAPIEQAAEAPAAVESSGYRKKRNNAYGDEPVAPSGGYAAAQPAPAPVEQAPAPIEQAAEAPAAVESSGYRKKRNNAYGDEPVAPAGGYAAAQPAPAPVEQAPAPIEQAAEAPAAVESSGYRRKRNNAYGDEPVAPSGGYAAAQPAPAPVEQAPAPIEQAAEAPAAVESSGY
uniref:Epicuticlin n=2 Tax=Ascaris suum TaxID=6253 RepID=Q95PB2_ASCSU|nr:epicuticlin [Ascaris suum]